MLSDRAALLRLMNQAVFDLIRIIYYSLSAAMRGGAGSHTESEATLFLS